LYYTSFECRYTESSVILHLHLFFFQCSADHRDLHSFPTRRSSDLEKEFHRLVGLRDSRGAVEGYASRLYVDLLCGHIVSIFFARRVLRALQIELHLTAANNILSVFFVLAAMRVYDVVTLAGLSKTAVLDVFHDARCILLD